jgi:hypothetical protein
MTDDLAKAREALGNPGGEQKAQAWALIAIADLLASLDTDLESIADDLAAINGAIRNLKNER